MGFKLYIYCIYTEKSRGKDRVNTVFMTPQKNERKNCFVLCRREQLKKIKKERRKNIFCFVIRKILIQATEIRQYGANLKNQIVG